MKNKVAVLGGGISGLLSAYFLSKEGYEVDLYEKTNLLGGLLGTLETTSGGSLEKYYHHFFKNDKYLLKLLEELDLNNKIIWTESSVSLLKEGKFYDFSTAKDLLNCSLFSLKSKIRMGIGTLILSRTNSLFLYNLTAKELIEKVMGSESYKKLWEPLFEGKFEKHANKIAAPWFVERLKKRSKSRVNGCEILGYIEGSFSLLTEKLEKEILRNKGKILKNYKINEASTYRATLDNKKYNLIVSTLPLSLLSEIVKEDFIFPKTEYTGIICAVLELKKKQSKYYWTNVLDSNIPFQCMIEHTNLISEKNYGKKHIMYLGQYINPDLPMFFKDSKELKKEYLFHLRKIFPKIEKEITSFKIFKNKKAQPIVKNGYKKPPIKIGNNFYVTSMAHIYPGDRGINEAIREVRNLVGKIKQENKI